MNTMRASAGNGSSMKSLFEPGSIAVIGASSDPNKVGHILMDNIVNCGYSGEVYPINLKGGELFGKKVFTSLDQVDNGRVNGDNEVGRASGIDLALITIPAKFVFDALKQCAASGVKNVVIITSGFSEIGNVSEEAEMVEYAREHGMRVMGPNVFGIYSAAASLNATFGPKGMKAGKVAIITQSGAIGTALIGKTKAMNLGLSAIVSVGNKADLDEADLLEYLVDDPGTEIIMMYIEGMKAGRRIVDLLKRATRVKPVVVIKSGRSKRGALAAASHTGSLAGADEVFDDVIRQCGAMRAEGIQEALDWCKFISNSRLPKGDNTLIITNGGGIGVMAADACEKFNVQLYDDSKALREAFSEVMPEYGSAKNPVDITGGASAEDYDRSLKTALAMDSVDSVICLGCQTAYFDAEKFSKIVKENWEEYRNTKPIVFAVMGGEEVDREVINLMELDIPIFPDVYDAVSCMGSLYSFHRNVMAPAQDISLPDLDLDAMAQTIKDVQRAGRHFLLADEGRAVMEACGVPVPGSKVARNLAQAADYAEEIGYPVVMKVVSKDIVHKSDAGGIMLNIANKNEVVDAYEAIMFNAHRHVPAAVITGVEISNMVVGGLETIVGARQDPSFGPVVMFGLGGVYVEIMKDVAFRAFPLSRSEILDMIGQTKAYPLIMGARGEARKDLEAVVDAIQMVGHTLIRNPGITDIEINPLLVFEQGKGAKALDARILLSIDREKEATK